MRYTGFATLFSFLALLGSPALAQTTAPATAPAAPVGGGVGDYWWWIIVVIIVLAVIWYMMRGRRTRV